MQDHLTSATYSFRGCDRMLFNLKFWNGDCCSDRGDGVCGLCAQQYIISRKLDICRTRLITRFLCQRLEDQ